MEKSGAPRLFGRGRRASWCDETRDRILTWIASANALGWLRCGFCGAPYGSEPCEPEGLLRGLGSVGVLLRRYSLQFVDILLRDGDIARIGQRLRPAAQATPHPSRPPALPP